MRPTNVAWMQRSEIRGGTTPVGQFPGFRLAASGLLTLLLASAPAQAELAASLHQDWLTPRAAEFAQASAALVPALQAACASPAGLEPARTAWKHSLAAWESLAGVAIGPVLERRSQRAIDFTPTRPRMIEKAIKAQPNSPAELELIGTPAKGLPALEWLLWVKPVAPATPECRYAVALARDIQREAEAIASTPGAATDDPALLSELVNQWVGGVERLRWPGMEMPLRVAMTSAQAIEPDYPRRDSGAAGIAWAAQWRALKHLAASGPGSMAGVLRGRGQNQVAEALIQAVAQADAAMHGLSGADREAILAAAKRLAGLKQQVETVVAPALGVSIGFSDADGD
jgi:uncharacterized protein